jgi:Mg-chelatase subunit ChlD
LKQIVSVVVNLIGPAAVAQANAAQRPGGKLPPVRFGLVAFKDYGDEYGIEATRSLPLTGDVNKLQATLDQVTAGGGGDIPEPLQDALKAASNVRVMGWSRQRKNVIVFVTDAPCHSLGRDAMAYEARTFAKSLGGQINVIDVGGKADGKRVRETVLSDLHRIAQEGNGSAFLLEDDQAFWKHLIVSIFGQRYEQDLKQIIDKYAKHEK